MGQAMPLVMENMVLVLWFVVDLRELEVVLAIRFPVLPGNGRLFVHVAVARVEGLR